MGSQSHAASWNPLPKIVPNSTSIGNVGRAIINYPNFDGWNPTHQNGDEWGVVQMTLLYQHYLVMPLVMPLVHGDATGPRHMALHSLLLNGSALLLVPVEELPRPEFLCACAEQGQVGWCRDDPTMCFKRWVHYARGYQHILTYMKTYINMY